MNRQRGMVLIMAMLIVVLVTSIAVSLAWRYNLSLTRSENRLHGMQAMSYLEGAESLAAVVLREDFEQDQQNGRLVDSLDEFWAQPSDPFPTDEGWVQGSIEDAQGRFNINLMQELAPALQNPNVDPNSVPLAQRFTASQKRFIRLLQTFEFEEGPLDEVRAVEITEAVIDWIDHDDRVTGFGGAEADYYQQLDPPTTPANLPMISVSELSRIRGMTPEIYEALLPYVIALPPDVPLNVNTIPLPLMRTMAGGQHLAPLIEEDAQMLLDERNAMAEGGEMLGGEEDAGATAGGYETVAAFAASPILTEQASNFGGFEDDGLAVQSSYFLLFSETQVGEQTRSARSMLMRAEGRVRVIRRSDANF